MTPQMVSTVITHGNRHNTYSGAQLCINMKSKYAVLVERTTDKVLSVFKGIDQQKLEEWIIERDQAISQAKNTVAKRTAYKMANADQQKRALTKIEKKHGDLKID